MCTKFLLVRVKVESEESKTVIVFLEYKRVPFLELFLHFLFLFIVQNVVKYIIIGKCQLSINHIIIFIFYGFILDVSFYNFTLTIWHFLLLWIFFIQWNPPLFFQTTFVLEIHLCNIHFHFTLDCIILIIKEFFIQFLNNLCLFFFGGNFSFRIISFSSNLQERLTKLSFNILFKFILNRGYFFEIINFLM